MGNIIRLAPYAYLAKRNGNGNIYDLLLLVPVGASGDTDLSNIQPVKTGGNKITVDYTTSNSATNALYRVRHWEIDSEGRYQYIQIQGDERSDRTVVLAFEDADDEPAMVSNQQQTCAPYLFVKVESVGNTDFAHPSCIILFDPGLGLYHEDIIFATNTCAPTVTLGSNGGVITDPSRFVINQHVKAKLIPNQTFIFEGTVAGNSNYNKPPRKTKVKVNWAI
ncbi:MAG: hypothetical protein SFV22_03505 [Saprospiraceae bacterium]|nr:hypothetical protein [Saprospiraceae bacterium]